MRAIIAAGWVAAALLLPGPGFAQTSQTSQAPSSSPPASSGTPANQPQEKSKPPTPQKFRAPDGDLKMSQVIGASVSNDQNQVIGTISDVLLDKQDKADRVVLSVGGFLGVGSRLVQVPFSHLKIGADKIVLPGATKVSLENLSAYQAQ